MKFLPLIAMAAALIALSERSDATTPLTATPQVAGFYRQAIGPLRVTALFDGATALPRQRLSGVAPETIAQLLKQSYVPQNRNGVQTAVTAYLMQRGSQLILVDTGAAQCFGPALGQVLSNLRAAGYEPGQVDDVLLTHAHPDHICGLLDSNGEPAYPNARVWLSRVDADYWLDSTSEAAAPAPLKAAFALARKALAPYQRNGKLQLFAANDKPFDGVTALDSHGHTPGHVSYLFDGDDARLLVWGDVVHYHAVQFAEPDAWFDVDSDHDAAIAARRELLRRAADDGWWVAGAHLPFPGLGHVRRKAPAFAWIPTEFSPMPAASTP